MKLRSLIIPISTVALAGAMVAAPMTASAQGWHRHSDRSTWNGLAIGAAAVGIYGIASHQPGLAALGILGAGYSAIRANSDDDDDWRPVYQGYGEPYYGGYVQPRYYGGYAESRGYDRARVDWGSRGYSHMNRNDRSRREGRRDWRRF